LTIKDDSTPPYFGADDALLIQDCSNVSITGLVAIREPNVSLNAAVRIDRSSVRMSDVTVNVGRQVSDSVAGTPAIKFTGSFAVISGMDLQGGDGGKGGNLGGYTCGDGGRGGDAVRATGSQVFLVGYNTRYSDKLQGGNGGDSPSPDHCAGGDGGDGFWGGVAQVSNVTLLGGAGGTGYAGNGNPGLPWEGNLTESDVVPYLAMSGNFHPGSTFYLDLDVVDAGALIVVFADHQGFVPIWGNAGPPLGAIPGGRFVTFYGGHLGALGHTTLSLVLPDDHSLSGIPLNAQCAVLLDAGGFILSNATTHVVAE
jgi:hypothetical protein